MTEQPSPLLQALDDMLEGVLEPAALLEKLDRGMEELSTMEKDFSHALSMQPPSVRQGCQEEIRLIGRLFEEYARTLTEASSYVKSPDRRGLRRLRREILELTCRLSTGFLRFREAALVAIGPSAHGGINLLIQNLRQIQAGASTEELRHNASLVDMQIEAAISHLVTSLPVDLKRAPVRFYDELLVVTKELQNPSYPITGTVADVLVKRLESLGERFQYVDIAHITRNYSREPSSLPFVNIIVNCAPLTARGLMDKPLFLFMIKSFKELLSLLMQKSGDGSFHYPLINEKLMKALLLMRESIEQYGASAAHDDWDALASCREEVNRAAMALEGALLLIGEHSDDKGLIPCLKCGTPNDRDAMRCSICGAVMPLILQEMTPSFTFDDDGSGSDHSMTAGLFRLLDGAKAYQEKAMTKERFLDLISGMEGLVERSAEALKNAPPESEDLEAREMRRQLEKAHRLYLEALKDLAGGLKCFREYADSLSEEEKESAEDMLWEGISALKKVQKLLYPVVSSRIHK